jgi:hypothetical protein
MGLELEGGELYVFFALFYRSDTADIHAEALAPMPDLWVAGVPYPRLLP